MTETCGVISLESPERGKARQLGSSGTFVTQVEAKIVDVETLEHLPPIQLGEICVRGPNVMQGTASTAFLFSPFVYSKGALLTSICWPTTTHNSEAQSNNMAI